MLVCCEISKLEFCKILPIGWSTFGKVISGIKRVGLYTFYGPRPTVYSYWNDIFTQPFLLNIGRFTLIPACVMHFDVNHNKCNMLWRFLFHFSTTCLSTGKPVLWFIHWPILRNFVPCRGGAPIGAGGGVISPHFLHRKGQGVQKLMTIIHVFKHVMCFLAFHKLNVFNFLTPSR